MSVKKKYNICKERKEKKRILFWTLLSNEKEGQCRKKKRIIMKCIGKREKKKPVKKYMGKGIVCKERKERKRILFWTLLSNEKEGQFELSQSHLLRL